MRSHSALQRGSQLQDAPPIFINHGDINININLNNQDKGIDHSNIRSFILKNIQEQIHRRPGDARGQTQSAHGAGHYKPHSSAGGRRAQNLTGTLSNSRGSNTQAAQPSWQAQPEAPAPGNPSASEFIVKNKRGEAMMNGTNSAQTRQSYGFDSSSSQGPVSGGMHLDVKSNSISRQSTGGTSKPFKILKPAAAATAMYSQANTSSLNQHQSDAHAAHFF